MQAILTKYLRATDTKPSRIKATCERGSITISYPHELSGDAVHIAAADALVARFVKEDAKRYGSHRNPWSRPRVCGMLSTGEGCHVYAPMLEDWSSLSVVVQFQDKDDKKHFADYVERAKKTEGTVAPLWSGIMSSVMKKATVS